MAGFPALTPRERDVLACLVDGMTNAEIARELHVSVSTVKTYMSKLLAKLGVENRTQAAISYVRDENLRTAQATAGALAAG
jgi:DNA-binding NarL/FixJ family response regulator